MVPYAVSLLANGQNLGSLWAQAFTQRGGEVAPFPTEPYRFHRILGSRSTSMSLHHRPSAHGYYCTSWVLSDLWLMSMGTLEVVLSGRVDGSHHLVNGHFGACAWLRVYMSARHHRPTLTSCIAVALLLLVGCMPFALKDRLGLLQHDHGRVLKGWIASWNLTSGGPRFLTWLFLFAESV